MTVHVTTRVAKLASRLADLGTRHTELNSRIAEVERRVTPNEIALRRLKREKLRLEAEMQQYEGVLRTLSVKLTA